MSGLYQISGTDVLYQWVSEQTDSAAVQAMLDWLPVLAADPYDQGQFIPKRGVPVLAAPTPVQDTMVIYSVVEQFHCVNLIRFDKV